MARTTFLIAAGANLTSPAGAPVDTLRAAIGLLGRDDTMVTGLSQWFSTPAFPAGSGPDYVNGAARVESMLAPEEMLARLHEIEAGLGRRRDRRWGPRACDLDLIAAGTRVSPDPATVRRWIDLSPDDQARIAPERLILPHPRMHERAFVLAPLAEVAPDWRHPVLGLSVVEMLAGLPAADRAAVRPLRG
ncbi:MAG: 2-amino-4-hydroxy-6-hydroxymethyldihydropteridine diphosphokinase [Rhodovulum sulfidophilum]|uniref:2-amino-4-hydroxy-6-hydroxymethyldihydropteridine pyrophosphokinase n=1 Tax=Rhodovulum sulfidophilum TaxID=35806 RepID=A0A2W5NNL2_RHOSU|nr:MAG: 2-amino-4-hydroxy-6-hydroxymethyldihydropteridine diphosphokinase [Rhodovulum sulfidophilum]